MAMDGSVNIIISEIQIDGISTGKIKAWSFHEY
jgi:hypothetical protein